MPPPQPSPRGGGENKLHRPVQRPRMTSGSDDKAQEPSPALCQTEREEVATEQSYPRSTHSSLTMRCEDITEASDFRHLSTVSGIAVDLRYAGVKHFVGR